LFANAERPTDTARVEAAATTPRRKNARRPVRRFSTISPPVAGRQSDPNESSFIVTARIGSIEKLLKKTLMNVVRQTTIEEASGGQSCDERNESR
jgi:hypothetical protein